MLDRIHLLDMLRIYDGVEDRNEHGENMDQQFLVSQIDPEDIQFKEYIARTPMYLFIKKCSQDK